MFLDVFGYFWCRALQDLVDAKDDEIRRNDVDKAALNQSIQVDAGRIQGLNALVAIGRHTINAYKDLLVCTNKKMDAMQAVIDELKKTMHEAVNDEPEKTMAEPEMTIENQ